MKKLGFQTPNLFIKFRSSWLYDDNYSVDEVFDLNAIERPHRFIAHNRWQC